MKVIMNILIIMAVLIFSSPALHSQEVRKDTATVRQQAQEQVRSGEQDGKQTQSQTRNQATQGNQSGNQGDQSGSQAGNRSNSASGSAGSAQSQGANAAGVKKIQGARPDWSKIRGARPASVERPSGSRIQKGAGKPGCKRPG